jgi:rfaE bifunctional protein nucleotidyltransferase chain/domain
MIKVFFQGTFDLLNYGHVRAFEDAKKQGDYLIVALNTDDLIRRYKKREPILPYEQREVILKAVRFIDEVIPVDEFSPLELLKKHNINVYVIGNEWKASKVKEINYMKSIGGKVFFTPEYDGVIHSSEIRRRCVQDASKTGKI